MKKALLILFAGLSLSLQAQNVGINSDNSNPNPSAILDVKSTDKGVLVPRMTAAQKLAVALPATGLLIFQTDATAGFYYYNGTAWVQLGGNDNDWLYNGTHIYNGNTGNVGVGTLSPAVQFTVDGGIDASLAAGSGYMMINAENTTNLLFDDNEIIARNNGATSPLYVQSNGGDFRVHNPVAGTQFVVLDNGNVGIGTTIPANKLVVAGTSSRVEFLGTVDADGTSGSGVLEIANSLRLDGNEIITNTGTTLLLNDDNGGNIRMDNGTFFLDAANNQVGIGTTNPGNDLHVVGSSTGHVARIENISTDASADGLVIELSGVTGANNSDNNNYITFERSGGVVVGRIEGFELDNVNPVGWGVCDWVETGIAPDPWSAATAGATLACLDEGITYSSGNGDYAEWLERENPNSSYAFGMVVGVRSGKINLNTQDAEQIMVVSAAPIVLGNMPPNGSEKNYEKVAFMGQVPVAVMGKVNSGDYLVPSGKNDGSSIAISPADLKMEHLKTVFGRSWQTKETEGFGFVNTIVGVKMNEIAEIFENKLKRLEQLEKDVKEIKAMLTQTATNK